MRRGEWKSSGLNEDLSHCPSCKIKGICLLFSLLLPSCSFKYKLFKESYIKILTAPYGSSMWWEDQSFFFPISYAGFGARVYFFFPPKQIVSSSCLCCGNSFWVVWICWQRQKSGQSMEKRVNVLRKALVACCWWDSGAEAGTRDFSASPDPDEKADCSQNTQGC